MDNDIIDISMDFNDLENPWNKKTNFGSGIEVLMNDKRPERQGVSSNIDIEDLDEEHLEVFCQI